MRRLQAGDCGARVEHIRGGDELSELFELSKLEAQQTVPQPEPFPLPELVRDVLLALQPIAEANDLHLSADALRTSGPLVCADVGPLERVLHNLLDNALRFTPAGGHLTQHGPGN